MKHYTYFHSELFSPQWISIPKAIFPSFQFNLTAITVKNSGNNALICKMNSASFHYGFPFRLAHFLLELYTFTWNKNIRIFPYFDSLKRRNWNCMNVCCHKPFYYCRLFSSFNQVFRGKGSSFDEKAPVLTKMFLFWWKCVDQKVPVLMKRLKFWWKAPVLTKRFLFLLWWKGSCTVGTSKLYITMSYPGWTLVRLSHNFQNYYTAHQLLAALLFFLRTPCSQFT